MKNLTQTVMIIGFVFMAQTVTNVDVLSIVSFIFLLLAAALTFMEARITHASEAVHKLRIKQLEDALTTVKGLEFVVRKKIRENRDAEKLERVRKRKVTKKKVAKKKVAKKATKKTTKKK